MLEGGAGNDALDGGGGADTFVFASGHGTDRIANFEDADTIRIADSSVTYSDLTIVADANDADDANITWSGGTIILEDVNHTTLSEQKDFIFG